VTATAVLHLAVAVLTGASAARLWLGRDGSAWARVCRRRLRGAALAGAIVALLADTVQLWLASAAMAEVPVSRAAGATWTMLNSTHLGFAWSIGMAGLLAAAVGTCMRTAGARGPASLTLASLAVFWYTRSMVSHAAGDGDFSVRLLADWLHLGLVSLWVGEVLLAAALMLRPGGDMAPAGRRARAAYVASLSSSATIALGGIFVTGAYAGWRSLGGFAGLADNIADELANTRYGNLLAAKLLLVAVAAMLGGFNRWCVMRPWLALEAGNGAGDGEVPASLAARFRQVLWVEALVLLAAVVLAAWLASTPAPGELIPVDGNA
jgi:putative copper resistance protein D